MSAFPRAVRSSSRPSSGSASSSAVSPNIVEASFDALHDAITFKLFRDGAKAI